MESIFFSLKRSDHGGLEAISKMQITLKDKARADEKAQHTWEYVSILRRLATPKFGVRWGFETTSNQKREGTDESYFDYY